MKPNYLVRGLRGHPLHAPLTDATIGTYTVSTALACASVIGVSRIQAAHGCWLALVACLLGHTGYTHGAVDTGPSIVALVGSATLVLGGWLGGSIVFVRGMRVLNLVTEPAKRAATPIPKPEKEVAGRG